MRIVALLLVLSAPWAFSQEPAAPVHGSSNLTQRVQAPSYSDMYCSGFISKQGFPAANYVAAGAESPNQTQFRQTDVLFLDGTGYTEGARLSVIRPLRDPNRSRAYPTQAASIAALGQPYADLGRVRVTALRGKMAIAVVEFSCSPIVPGDLVTPFEEKPPVAYRPKTEFERFPAAASSVTARIVMAKDFDYLVGAGQKVYISAGADKGVKVGDYFRAVRNYDPAKMDAVDALSLRVPQSEETQQYGTELSKAKYAELPRRAVAEMIVLNVTPTSSTALVTYSVENIIVGDTVELEGGGSQ
ncbi:MAG TPA: hypothetical protein VFI82_07520 [Terriglobales bacterium]|nr:hypothetical protein [Terriglobales bacterium]